MADFLAYWKDYWRDIAKDTHAVNHYWHTANKSFFDKAQRGDVLWVVVSAGKRHPHQWRLIQRLVVRSKRINRGAKRPFQIVGSRKRTETFAIAAQPDFTGVLRTLQFSTGKKIRAKGRAIGNTLQTLRRLTAGDAEQLEKYSQSLHQYDLEEKFSDLIEKEIKIGSFFGDPETNRQVEQAAVKCVRRLYESAGWKVRSREKEKLGYDLDCSKGSIEEHVEVKGTQGEVSRFIITAREFMRAKNDNAFVLLVVRSALTAPEPVRYTARQVIESFIFNPLAYQAVLRRIEAS
jgi:hypothetical protein